MDVELISRAAVLRMLDENGVVFRGEIEKIPAVDAIPVEWLCEKIRDEEKFGGIPFGEYIKVLIWDWHQQEQEAGK